MLIIIHPIMFFAIFRNDDLLLWFFHPTSLAVTVNFGQTIYSVTEGGDVVLVIVTDREADRDIIVDLDLFDLSAMCK